MSLTAEQRAAIKLDQQRINAESIRKGAEERAARKSPPLFRDQANDRATAKVDEFTADWRSALAKRGERFAGDERNVLLALKLAPELRDLIRYNEFALTVELTRGAPWDGTAPRVWTDDDDVGLQVWLQERGLAVDRRGPVADAVAVAAKWASYHPVRAYLSGLKWDGTPRLDGWLAEYLDSKQGISYLAAIGRAWLISAVARALRPGCKADHVLVLEGGQGIGKSTAAATLAIRPDWFADDLPDIATKDGAIQLCGRWIVELGELAAVRRTEIEKVKSYITRTVDVFRPPYGRRAISVPRQTVFIATTNEVHYLRDRTGNRRFWPVRCGRIDLDALERDRDQLWAEATHAFMQGEAWYLDRDLGALAEQEQRSRVLVTQLEESVSNYLASLSDSETTVHDVLVHGLRMDPDKSDFAERATRLGAQVSDAMRAAGWEFVERQGRGPNRRRIYRRVIHT